MNPNLQSQVYQGDDKASNTYSDAVIQRKLNHRHRVIPHRIAALNINRIGI